MSSFQVGVAQSDITPPVGIPMVGFAGRGPSVEVHDPLTATALAVEYGSRRAVLITTDLLGFKAETARAIRNAIETSTGVPAEAVTIACAHNHYGPDVDRDQESGIVAAYAENLGHVLVGMVSEALDDLTPARLGVGWGSSDIGINRRERRPDGSIWLGQNPDGPIDRAVGVARIDDVAGEPIACLVNFACHPVSQSGQMRALSADFVGQARDIIEELTGAACLYLQGACGNINPIRMENDYEPARSLGVRLGCEVVRVWETIECDDVSALAVVGKEVALPGFRYGSAEDGARLAEELDAQVKRLAAEGGSEGARWWAERRRDRVRAALESWRTGHPLPEIPAELQAWRLGELSFATAPGEVFTEIGEAVKDKSPARHTFFVGYTNGSIGYVPTRAAYAEGGYEVTHACQVDPDAGDIIRERCLELLRHVSTAASVT